MLQVDVPQYNVGDPIRARHLNSAFGAVKALVKSLPANSLIDSTGIHTPRPRSHSAIRLAFCKTDAPASSTIICYLDIDETGEEISVKCDIIGTSDLNNAVVRLVDGYPLKVAMINGEWHCLGDFQKSLDCD